MLQLSALVRAAVEDNTLTIEPVASQTPPTAKVAAVECGSTKYVQRPSPFLAHLREPHLALSSAEGVARD